MPDQPPRTSSFPSAVGPVSPALVRDVELLCLDAGNTIVFLDHATVARIAGAEGFALTALALERAEGDAKRALDRGPGAMATPPTRDGVLPGWGAFMRTMLELAGVPPGEPSERVTLAAWREHVAFNLWRRVPDGLFDAVNALRARGVPVCVVSNSEGRLHTLFEQLGILGAFDLVIDSQRLGIEKPDARIFAHALKHFGVAAEHALHLGDVVATDIVGARAAGVRAALIDPLGHYAGQHPEVERVPGVVAVAEALVAVRQRDGVRPPIR